MAIGALTTGTDPNRTRQAFAPGEPILAGEWAKAKKLIAEGKDIDYKGAGGDHEFDAAGDVPGNYAFFKVSGTGYESIADMK